MSTVAIERPMRLSKTSAILIDDASLSETVILEKTFHLTGECLHTQNGEVLALLDRGRWFDIHGNQLLCIHFPSASRLRIRSKIATAEHRISTPLRLSGGMLWATWPISFFSGGRWYSYSVTDELCRTISIR